MHHSQVRNCTIAGSRNTKFESLLILIALVVTCTWGIAQTTTATLSGVLTDGTGAVLPGAQVIVLNTNTGVQRSSSTDEKGSFVVAELPPGPYQVTLTLAGFETLVRTGITLVVGQKANLPLVMKVGAVTEQITVTGEAPIVNTNSSSVAGLVDEQRILALPLNGRDFSQLPLVLPGVYSDRNTASNSTKGFGTRVSMAGSRPDQTAWLLDGTNIKSMSNFGTPGSASGVMLGVDAVQEFQVLVTNYSSEFGGTSGGVVNMVSKSGGNGLHGTVYYDIRNSVLDARGFFDQQKPAFKRNQFGGSLGGAIRKDKTFFFGNFEGLRQRMGLTTVGVVPDANVHNGLIPASGSGLQQVAVAPEIRPYLDVWPLPNGPELGGGLANRFGAGNNPIGENYFVTRVDHHINDQQSLFARFTFDRGTLSTPDPLSVFNVPVDTDTRYATVQYENVISPRFLATSRVAYNRTRNTSNDVSLINFPKSLDIIDPSFPPTLSFPGVTAFGAPGTSVFGKVQNLYQFQESMQYVRGTHSMRFGADIQHVGLNVRQAQNGFNGNFGWSTMQAFLLDNIMQTITAIAPGSNQARTWMQYVYAGYFQDDWSLRRNFTLNLGLRYENFTTPTEKHGRVSVVKNILTATAFDVGVPMWQNPSTKDFSPRVGFAWDVTGNGKTAIRGGFGLFYVDLLGGYYGTTGGSDPPYFAAITTVQGNLASAVSDIARVGPSVLTAVMNPNSFPQFIQWNLNPSYEMKFNLAAERQLGGNVSVAAAYVGGRAIHLIRETDANAAPPILVNGRPFVPAGTPRVNPNTGLAEVRWSDGQSFYNGLQMEVKKRFSRGLQFQASYSLSKNIDDGTTGVATSDYNESNSSQPFNPKGDRGLSALHQGQNLVISGTYRFPSPIQSGFMAHFVNGWQFSEIFTATSGTPFSATVSGFNVPDLTAGAARERPDLVAGRNSSNIVTGNPTQYFDPKAFFLPPPGFYGDAGRNILMGPGFVNFDLSLEKNTPVRIREGSRLEFRTDFFNLFNRTNFGPPGSTQILNPSNRQYIAGAGQLTKLVGSARQLQFGLKLVF